MITALRNRIKKLPSWLFWTGMVILGLLLLIFNDVFGENESYIIFSLFYFLFLTLSILRWIFKQVRSIIALKTEKSKMEMLHLKSQVNPHFFFNTLNNLYGLVEKDPQEAKNLILKLSDLMRYSIYDGQKEWVTLEEEMDYLKNYVDIQKNRYHKKVRVDFTATINNQGYRIMPLLLILLVENAFKHGVEKLRNDALVEIEVVAENDRIDFKIINNFDPEEDIVQESGIGIVNLKRRLEIGYKKDFTLELSKKQETFEAKLSLNKV